MRKLFYLFMVAMCATMFTACSKDDDKDPLDDNGGNGSKEGMITMITENDGIGMDIETFNEGDIITIDWGDGTVEEFKSVEEYDDWDEDGEDEIHYVISIDDYVKHEYSNRNPHIVTIKGKIKYLDCKGNNLTSLDVSGCTALTELDCCDNNLTSLDVSKNTALTWLDCEDNKLTSSALNQIFRDLPQGKTWTEGHGRTEQSSIIIYDNPGSNTCDKSIAENKGWYVW